MELIQKLKDKIQGDISTSETDIAEYSTDASIFKITPEAIVFPKNVDDIKQLVNLATEHKKDHPTLSLTPRGGGTCMSGGSINDSLILDMTKYFNVMGKLKEETITTEPGVMYRDMETSLLAQNRLMPAYPSSRQWCATGGMVGNNCGGEQTFPYGQAKEFVTDLQVVLADGNEYTIKPLTESELEHKKKLQTFEGELYRKLHQLITDNYRLIQKAKPTTSKNAAGYFLWDVWDGKTFDLTKLFTGSQGTLGIITNITWRTIPIKRVKQLAVFEINDLSELGNIVNEASQFKPESLEVFDDQTYRLALKYIFEMVRKMPDNDLLEIWNFRQDLWRYFSGQLPKLTLLAQFAGDSQEQVDTQAELLREKLHNRFDLKSHVAHNEIDRKKYWAIRHESYNLLRKHNARMLSAPFIEDVTVHPNQLPEFLPRLDAIIKKYPAFITTMAGHAGDANFHIIPLVDIEVEQNRKDIVNMSKEVFDLVMEFDGSITAEHNDGLSRGAFLDKMFSPEVLSVFKEVKQLFDPLNIFNPHKKTEATLEYYEQHIKHHK